MTPTTSSASASSKLRSSSQFDVLADFNRPPVKPIDWWKAMRLLFAVMTLGSGLGVIIWLVYVVHLTLTNPTGFDMLHRLGSIEPKNMVVTIGAETLQLPTVLLTVIGYFILFLLLAIIGRVGVALIKEGSWMLRSDTSSDLRREYADRKESVDCS